MRVDRDRLVFLDLALLQRAAAEMRVHGPIKPGPEVRLALAVLFTFSRSGERANYDRFWRSLSARYENAYSESAARTFRHNEAHSCFEWISRDVCAPANMEYRARLYEFLEGADPGRRSRETAA